METSKVIKKVVYLPRANTENPKLIFQPTIGFPKDFDDGKKMELRRIEIKFNVFPNCDRIDCFFDEGRKAEYYGNVVQIDYYD